MNSPSETVLPSEQRVMGKPLPPWGELEITTIELERPTESFPVHGLTTAAPEVRWFFRLPSEEKILTSLQACGLTAEQLIPLRDPSRWHREAEGWRLVPTKQWIRDLSIPARETVYGLLRQDRRNVSYCRPFEVPIDRFDSWLAESGLPPAKQAVFRKLSYVRGDAVCFSDCEVMEAECSPEEARELARALSRVPTLLVRLKVSRDSDTEALIGYWGRAGRGRAMKPFLDSLKEVPGGETVNVSFFFPQLMRMRLYTYPQPPTNAASSAADCYWTAMNFFNGAPDDRFFDGAYSRRVLETLYTRVDRDWMFGDLIALVAGDGSVVHMCVQVADDVVFTKNGADLLAPWVLMRFPQMMARYPASPPLQAIGFRRLELLSGSPTAPDVRPGG